VCIFVCVYAYIYKGWHKLFGHVLTCDVTSFFWFSQIFFCRQNAVNLKNTSLGKCIPADNLRVRHLILSFQIMHNANQFFNTMTPRVVRFGALH
jgi:hypothetical protein